MSDHKRERTVEKRGITPRPTAKQMWNWWWRKIPLPEIVVEFTNNGREYQNGKDETFINFNQKGMEKYFTTRIIKDEE